MSTWIPMLAQPPMGSYMETWMPLCGSVCPSHPASGHTSWLECVHASVHEFMSTWLPMSTPSPMHSWMETWMPLCGIMCLSQLPYFCSPTCLDCVHASAHVFMSTWLPMSAPSLCIVWWKPGCPCMPMFLCPSHLISIPTHCLECVQASEHVFMSTWIPMLAQPPMDSYMETWVTLCDSVCVCPSHPASGHTPWLECVHASVHEFMSTWLPMSTPSPMHSWMETWMPLCGIMCLSQLPYFCSPTCLDCVHASAHVFMSTWLPMSAPSLCIVWWKTWVPMYANVFVSQSPYFHSHTLFRMCTSIRTCIYVHMNPHVSSTPYG